MICGRNILAPLSLQLFKLVYSLYSRFNPHRPDIQSQCAATRREATALRHVNGILWDAGTVSNCVWSGVFLRDVLTQAGVAPAPESHVCFASYASLCQDESYFGGSVPLSRALSADEDVLLAFEVCTRARVYSVVLT
jgi:sulfite oxidase